MTTSTVVVVALPSEAIVLRAVEEIMQLQQRRTTALELSVEVQSELADLSNRRTRLQQAHNVATDHLTTVQAELHKAEAWASVAQGAPVEATALARLKEVRAQEKAAHKAEREALKPLEEATATMAKREPVLQISIDENRALVQELDVKILALQAAREQAHEALGRETYERVGVQLQALQELVTSEGRDLIDTKLSLSAAREVAVTTLSPWPALAQRARHEFGVFEDATTRVLNAYLAFIDVLATDGPTAKATIARQYSLAGQIEIAGSFVVAILRHDRDIAQKIADLQSGAQRLLQLYLAEHS